MNAVKYATNPRVRWPGRGWPRDVVAMIDGDHDDAARFVLAAQPPFLAGAVPLGPFRVVGAVKKSLALPGTFATAEAAIDAALEASR